ncbi:acetyltransferase [Roseibacterium beibuensis]|uniref:acetyltransferase n=1 Tax=[Roseibacterium] beibuensis TaxID=1193142 RepID=UPI00217D28DC|nr:acetyltransferase [Roseibacterium beibuensis]MCS6627377.1 acetyltransferase [Roseibacterium beibuensis]
MIHLIGAGGHCKVVLDALLAGGADADEITVRDARPERAGELVLGIPVAFPELEDDLAGHAFHVAIGANEARARLMEAATVRGGTPLSIRHPSAQVSPFAVIGAGAFVGANAVVGPGAVVGAGALINHGAVVDHDVSVGEHAFVGAGSVLGGGASVGESAWLGPRSVVVSGKRVNAGAILPPGSVVADGPDVFSLPGAGSMAGRRP